MRTSPVDYGTSLRTGDGLQEGGVGRRRIGGRLYRLPIPDLTTRNPLTLGRGDATTETVPPPRSFSLPSQGSTRGSPSPGRPLFLRVFSRERVGGSETSARTSRPVDPLVVDEVNLVPVTVVYRLPVDGELSDNLFVSLLGVFPMKVGGSHDPSSSGSRLDVYVERQGCPEDGGRFRLFSTGLGAGVSGPLVGALS